VWVLAHSTAPKRFNQASPGPGTQAPSQAPRPPSCACCLPACLPFHLCATSQAALACSGPWVACPPAPPAVPRLLGCGTARTASAPRTGSPHAHPPQSCRCPLEMGRIRGRAQCGWGPGTQGGCTQGGTGQPQRWTGTARICVSPAPPSPAPPSCKQWHTRHFIVTLRYRTLAPTASSCRQAAHLHSFCSE